MKAHIEGKIIDVEPIDELEYMINVCKRINPNADIEFIFMVRDTHEIIKIKLCNLLHPLLE